MGKLNVLVGANGAGKSNFVDFFRLLRAMAEEGLQKFARESGGADGLCFQGPKVTTELMAHLAFGKNEYRFKLKPAVSGELLVLGEDIFSQQEGRWTCYSGVQTESRLKNWLGNTSEKNTYSSNEHSVSDAVKDWIVYHVHDTSKTAVMRRKHPVSNHRELQPDAGNIAPFLRQMREKNELHYRRICDTIRQVAPFFESFILDVEEEGDNLTTKLEWKQKGSSFPYQAWQLSDGTIRFICLTTALLQPTPPSMIVIDEPELGLHPFALEILSAIIHEVSERTQIIVSTQSPLLMNHFNPEQVVVVDREAGESRFQRLDADALSVWLEDYALGELLQKNIIEASPCYE